MKAIEKSAPSLRPLPEDGVREAVERSSVHLRREGFTVSWVLLPPPRRGRRPPDLLAAIGSRVVRVFVLQDSEIDKPETRERIRDAYRQGETRAYVRWPMSWRLLSNLSRWGLRGVSVSGW
jgi:hypothetical protein